MTTFDYVIVGGGTAGCVLANRLSADGRALACCCSRRGRADRYAVDPRPDRLRQDDVPPGLQLGVLRPSPSRRWTAARIYWPRGRCLGGSLVDQRPDLRARPARGLRRVGGGGQPRLGLARRAALLHPQRGQRARRERRCTAPTGRCACSDIRERHELIEAIIAGAGELGVPRTDDFNGGAQEGVGYYQLFTHKGLRCSTAVAYLRPARGRAEPARRDGRARDARAVRRAPRDAASSTGRAGARTRAARAREVMLAAGALQSPQLLQLSGIGPAALLAALRHSGRARAARRRREPAGPPAAAPHLPVHEADHDQRRPRVVVAVAARSACSGSSRARARSRSASTRAGCSRACCPSRRTPDIQFHFATLSADLAGAKPHPFSGFTFSVCQLRPDVARTRAHQVAPTRSRRRRCSRNYLSTERRPPLRASPAVRFARKLAAHARDAALRRRASTGPGRRRRTTTTLLDVLPRLRRHDLPPVRHLQDGRRRHGGRRRPAARARHRGRCAWSTARSCPRWSPATPTRRWS